MKIGPIVDLKNYRQYSTKFQDCLFEPITTAEVHLLNADAASRSAFLDGIQESACYFKDLGLKQLAYHLLDDVINNVILYDLIGDKPQYKKLLPQTDPLNAKHLLELQMEAMELASGIFGKKVVSIVHEGIFLNTNELESMETKLLQKLRSLFFNAINEIHSKYFLGNDNHVSICLESSPPFRGEQTNIQHFTDQLLSDICPRLRSPEKIVLDVSHVFMCRHYLESNKKEVFGLDIFRDQSWGKGKFHGIMNDYPEIAKIASCIGWIHLNDCTGIYGDNEGLPLFQKDSIVDWERLMTFIKQLDVPMILEIRSAEKDFSVIDKSLRNFVDMWKNTVI